MEGSRTGQQTSQELGYQWSPHISGLLSGDKHIQGVKKNSPVFVFFEEKNCKRGFYTGREIRFSCLFSIQNNFRVMHLAEIFTKQFGIYLTK